MVKREKMRKFLHRGSSMIIIDVELAKSLISEQFPEYKNLEIKPIPKSGWDNRMFVLGDDMLIRMPSVECYQAQIKKEYKFLPKFKNFLSFAIPEPIKIGKPSENFPWNWSMYKYIEGENSSNGNIKDKIEFAKDLAKFLNEFQNISTEGGPEAGEHNFYRGGDLNVYDDEVHESIKLLKDKIDEDVIFEIWNKAIKTKWDKKSVWVHGDISFGNLLVKDGKLCAIIDFGGIGIGDPACDLAIAWTDFDNEERKVFYDSLENIDENTCRRGCAWALWKALILASGFCDGPKDAIKKSWSAIETIIDDYKG